MPRSLPSATTDKTPHIVKFSGGRSSAMMLLTLLIERQLDPTRGLIIEAVKANAWIDEVTERNFPKYKLSQLNDKQPDMQISCAFILGYPQTARGSCTGDNKLGD